MANAILTAKAFTRLRRLADTRRAVERCDLCGREIPHDHDHLMEPAERRLSCACHPCAVLFTGEVGTRFRRVPKRVLKLDEFRISDGQWDALRLPISLAFFYRSTPAGRVIAAYPSPAGATESMLTLEAWEDIERENPILREMEPDVEALLVNRVGHSRGAAQPAYFLVPADQCYKLVGLIRMKWTGLSGGSEVWGAISQFTGELTRLAECAAEFSVPDLNFVVEGAEIIPFAAVPQIAFRLRVTNADENEVIGAVMLRCQFQLAVSRRHYSADEEARLLDLFGTTDRWGQTLRGMLWTQVNVIVPRFSGEVRIDVIVPCSFDFNVGATKYFHALSEGEIPVEFLFSGSIFYENDAGALQVFPVSWEKEATYRLPVATWRELIDRYYPNTAWLTVRRDLFEQIYRYKAERGIPTWDRALERILATAQPEAVT